MKIFLNIKKIKNNLKIFIVCKCQSICDLAMMLLEQVIGQQAPKSYLRKMWLEKKLPHALLLIGEEGTGGLPLAVAYSQYIFCKHKTEDDACGQCDNCKKIERLEHPDLHFSFPAIIPKPGQKALSKYFINEFRSFFHATPYGSTYDWLQFINAENKQGNIPAEECRAIIENLTLKSYEGGSKIQIIWRPEYFGKEGNILLKLIEEPPPDTYIFLVAEETENILSTILSRSQTVKLRPLTIAELSQGLIDKELTASKQSLQIAHLSHGSFTEALRILHHTDTNIFPEVRRFFNVIFKYDRLGISDFVEDWSKTGREQQKNFLQYVVELLEHAIKACYLPIDAATNLPDEEKDFIQKLRAKNISIPQLYEITRLLSAIIYKIQRNAHSKTQLHAGCIEAAMIIKGYQIHAI